MRSPSVAVAAAVHGLAVVVAAAVWSRPHLQRQ
jgi:hypothetical protein